MQACVFISALSMNERDDSFVYTNSRYPSFDSFFNFSYVNDDDWQAMFFYVLCRHLSYLSGFVYTKIR